MEAELAHRFFGAMIRVPLRERSAAYGAAIAAVEQFVDTEMKRDPIFEALARGMKRRRESEEQRLEKKSKQNATIIKSIGPGKKPQKAPTLEKSGPGRKKKKVVEDEQTLKEEEKNEDRKKEAEATMNTERSKRAAKRSSPVLPVVSSPKKPGKRRPVPSSSKRKDDTDLVDTGDTHPEEDQVKEDSMDVDTIIPTAEDTSAYVDPPPKKSHDTSTLFKQDQENRGSEREKEDLRNQHTVPHNEADAYSDDPISEEPIADARPLLIPTSIEQPPLVCGGNDFTYSAHHYQPSGGLQINTARGLSQPHLSLTATNARPPDLAPLSYPTSMINDQIISSFPAAAFTLQDGGPPPPLYSISDKHRPDKHQPRLILEPPSHLAPQRKGEDASTGFPARQTDDSQHHHGHS